jgi:hypothetical protein
LLTRNNLKPGIFTISPMANLIKYHINFNPGTK